MGNILTLELFEDLLSEQNIERHVLVYDSLGRGGTSFKYYILDFHPNEDVCHVRYGRIGKTIQEERYTVHGGRQKHKEKLRKGYEEVTEAIYKSMVGYGGKSAL